MVRKNGPQLGGVQVKSFSIYYLLDPTNGRVRYVGYSRDPGERYGAHLMQSFQRKTHKERWIASLIDRDQYPIMSVRCVVQGAEEAKRIEVLLIASLRQRGVDLVNTTRGGDGSAGFKWSEDNYRRHKIHWTTIGIHRPRPLKGVRQTQEHIAATMAANTPELLAQRGAAIKAGWARRNGAPTKKHGKGWSTLRWAVKQDISPAARLQRQLARAEKKLAKLRAES